MRNGKLAAATGLLALLLGGTEFLRAEEPLSWQGVLTYENDPGAAATLGASPIPYRHCVYYYSKGKPVDRR
jgi:hypothetical protein